MATRLWIAYPARTYPRTRVERFVVPAVTFLVAVLAWHLASLSMPPLLLPSPFDVAVRVARQAASGLAWQYLLPTLGPAVLGVLIAIVTSLALGLAASHSRVLAAVFEPFVALSQTVPLVALAPLLVLWLGYGAVPIAVLCAIVAFFPMVTTTIIGFRRLDMRALEAAMLDGADAWQRLWHVELPMAAPSILAGMRAGAALAMTGAVVGEFVMGGRGLGTLLTLSRQASDTTGMCTVIFWISAAAMVLYMLFAAAERAASNRLQGEGQ
jgi:NitT/TauT family transport system permease protein